MSESPEGVALEMAKTIASNASGLSHINFERSQFITLYLECLAATKGLMTRHETGLLRAAPADQPCNATSDRLRP